MNELFSDRFIVERGESGNERGNEEVRMKSDDRVKEFRY
jgi:hypothetical protein